MEDDMKASREQKHIFLEHKVDGLYDVTSQLRRLVDKIEHGESPPKLVAETTKEDILSLSVALDSMPGEIEENIKIIHEQIDRLNQLLF